MTPEEQKALDAAEATHSKSNPPGVGESILRGAYSGGTLGFAPFADPERQEKAFQTNPKAYGLGYGGATLAESFGPGIIAKGVQGGKAIRGAMTAGKVGKGLGTADDAANAITEANRIDNLRKNVRLGTASKEEIAAVNAADDARAAKEALAGQDATATKLATPPAAVPTPVTPPGMWDKIKGAITSTPAKITGVQAGGAAGDAIINPPTPPVTENDMHSEAEPESKSSPFGAIANYLAQAQGSKNQDVQQAAQLAQEANSTNDEDAKRKIAMALQSTPAGRAVGNSDSNVHEG